MTRRRHLRPPADRLAGLPAPGEGEARGRAWRLVAAAHAARPEADRSAARLRGAHRRRSVAVAAATCALVVAAAFTPPGEAVAEWVGRTVRAVVAPPPPRPAGLGVLPGGGRVLVLAGSAARGAPGSTGAPHIAGDRGRRQLLGAAGEATWSGHGRFVAVTRGSELIAVDLAGRRRWSLAAPAAVHGPRWSPDGFRIAYLAGRALRVVAGDGTADRLVAPARARRANTLAPVRLAPAAGAPPAWRPGPGHVLAYADARGRVAVVDADRGTVLFSVPAPAGVRRLAFSRAGDRLLVVGRRRARVLGGRSGHTVSTLAAAPGVENLTAAYARRGRDFALVRRRGGRSEVLLVHAAGGALRPRRLFAAGTLGPIAFSPRGDWLLVDWRETGSWMFLPVGGPAGRRARQITGVGRRFGARAATPVGWCCPPG